MDELIFQDNQRIANSNVLFPLRKTIHPNHSGQYLSRILTIRRQKTLIHAQIQGNSTIQKTTNSRLIRIGTNPLQKDHGGPVKPSPCRFTPKPRTIFVVAGG